MVQTCTRCGQESATNALEGLCPRCLGAVAFDVDVKGAVLDAPSVAKSTMVIESDDVPASDYPLPSDGRGTEGEGQRFGDYEILGEIAAGGMGVVYKARQVSLNRIVAVKMIRADRLARDDDIRRFRTEAQAAAQLQHPNIVAIHEVGEIDGQHFYSMDFVAGQSLSQKAREHPLSPKQAASYVEKIAEAIHYAHQRGILHRDLKPSNVLIDENDEPRVADFGLAKLMAGDSEMTMSGTVMGSPSYMPPEQASGRSREVTVRSDVYSLGAILYDVLCGRPPFRAETTMETLRQVLETEPVLPRVLNPRAPRDLETIVLKCLQKEPSKRYTSAEELSAELARFIRGEPIHARPISRPEKLWRWCKRKPALAGSLAAVLLSIALGFAGVLWQWKRAEDSNRQTQSANTRLEMERAELLFASDNSAEGLAAMARVLRQNPNDRAIAARLLSALSHRNFCLPTVALRHEAPATASGVDRDSGGLSETDALTNRYLSIPPFRHKASITSAQFSPDGRRVLTASKDKTARIWDGNTGSLLVRLEHDAEVLSAQFSPDGQRVVTASMDRTAKVWDAPTGQRLVDPFQHEGGVVVAEFSPDGEQVVTGSEDRKARIWNSRTGQLVTTLHHYEKVVFARFSVDGSQVLTAVIGDPGSGYLWESVAGKRLASFDQDERRAHPDFSPDGHLMITMEDIGLGVLRDVPSGGARGAPVRHNQAIYSAQFSPNNLSLATASRDNTARLWDAQTGQPLGEPLQHGNEVVCIRFSPDGRRVVTASWDNTARIWDAHRGHPLTEPLRHNSRVLFAEFSPDGQRVLTVAEGTDALIWDIRSEQPLALRLSHSKELLAVQFSPTGERVVTGSRDHTARIWSALTGEQVTEVNPGGDVRCAQFSPNGEQIVTAGYQRAGVVVWNAATGRLEGQRLKHRSPGPSDHAEFSPDGQRVVSVGRDRTARIWNFRTGQQLAELKHDDEVYTAQFSPDGQYVVTASYDKTARIWDSRTGRRLFTLKHDHFVISAWFSPDGERIVSASKDKTARIWQVRTGVPLTEPLQHDDELLSAFFSPDGSRVVTSAGNSAHIWDARTGEPHTRPLKHNARVNHARFSPDGRQIVTACNDGTLQLWDAETAHPLTEPFRHDSSVSHVVFSPNGRQVASASVDGTAGLWEVPLVSLPIPTWLPDLAEAVAGQRFNTRNMSEPVPLGQLFGLKERLTRSAATDVYMHWAKWFFADSATRAISPSSPISVTEYVRRRMEDNSLSGLREAVWLSPTNGLAQARLAWMALTNDSLRNPRQAAESEWQTRRALEQCPKDFELLWVWAQLCERLGKAPESWAALEKAAALESTDPRFWNTWGSMLEKTNRLDDALHAYTKAIELSIPSKDRRGSLTATVFQNRSKLFQRMNRLAEAAADNLAAHNLPARDPQSSSALVDLSSFYNGAIFGGPHLLGRTNLAGVEWDLRGMVELRPDTPISGIHVMQRCRRLHFLHTVGYRRNFREGEHIGTWRIYYANGEHHEIRLINRGHQAFLYGEEFWPPTTVVLRPATNAVWLYKGTWPNARPELPIATIDFLSTMQGVSPYVVAITADDRPDEEFPEFWNARGQSLEQTNRLEEALQAYTRAIELAGPVEDRYSFSGTVLVNRSKLFRRMNRLPEAAADNILALKLPLRDPNTPPELIDLTAFYSFASDERMTGRQTFENIQFDLRGEIVLGGLSAWNLPTHISGIAVARKSRRLHFLHASWRKTPEGTEIGAYVIHYAGGSSNTIPIVYGRDVRDGSRMSENPSSESRPRPVWERPLDNRNGIYRLYKTTWENPVPDLRIETIDFISRMTDAYPFLVAITAEP